MQQLAARAGRGTAAASVPRLLFGLQAARGIAAILVMLFHAPPLLQLYLGYAPFEHAFRFGHAGVDFFFVLSGFIIMHTHGGDLGRPERLHRYATRRFSRIYPIYWVICGLLLAMALFSPDRAAQLSFWHVVGSLLLIPHGQEPFLNVAWTLQYEVLFYLCFAAAILSRWAGPVLAALCLALVAVWLLFAPQATGAAFITPPYLLEFLGGVGVAMLVRRRLVPRPGTMAIAGVAAFLAVGLAENAGLMTHTGTASILLFGTASAMIIAGLAAVESEAGLVVPQPLIALGAASYVIYLIHFTGISVSARLLAALGVMRLVPGWLAFGLVLVSVLVVGLLMHRSIEQPLIAWFRGPRSVPQRAAATGD